MSGEPEQKDQPEQGVEALEKAEHEVEATLAKVKDEMGLVQDRYLRMLAEFENYKKRSERDRLASIKYANERLLEDLLPVLDHLEQALAATSGDAGAVVLGVKMVLKQFQETLERYGIQVFSAVGQPFDPSRHEAIEERADDEVPPLFVIAEYQKGYLLNERVVRPARVVVSKGKP